MTTGVGLKSMMWQLASWVLWHHWLHRLKRIWMVCVGWLGAHRIRKECLLCQDQQEVTPDWLNVLWYGCIAQPDWLDTHIKCHWWLVESFMVWIYMILTDILVMHSVCYDIRCCIMHSGQFQVTVFSQFCYVLLCNHDYIHCLNHRQAKDYITRCNETERKL